MIRSAILGPGLGLALLASTAPAEAGDARLSSRLYNADEVVRIDGRAGVQATIAFAEDERIENVAIGDSNSWQVTPNKRANLLFVKPLDARARTNLTVVTDRRSYFFDLVAAPTAKPMYLLRFTYPAEPKVQQAEAPAAAPTLTAEEALAARGQPPVDPAALNHAWAAKGKSRLLPSRVYDDGHTTYLSWAAGTPVPAILVKNEKGEEGPVNFAVRNDVIAVDGVPALIVLRSGKEMATLEYRGERRAAAARSQVAAATTAGTKVN
jgi:type IV secretion system protein VirB9